MNEIHCVIAFDFGLKRIGIAAGDTLTRTASPRPAVTVGADGPDWNAIAGVVRALAPGLLVVGAPYNVDDSPGALAGAKSTSYAENMAAQDEAIRAGADDALLVYAREHRVAAE